MTLPGTVERATRERRAVSGGPNKTEAEYNRLHLHGKGLYEAVAGDDGAVYEALRVAAYKARSAAENGR